MEDLNAAVRKQGALRGLLFGGIMLFIDILKLYYLAYYATSPFLTFFLLYPVSYIVLFGTGVFLVLNLRKKIGGYWTQRQAVTGIFIMLFLMSILKVYGEKVFSCINKPLSNRANTSLVQVRKKAMLSVENPSIEKINKEIRDMEKTLKEDASFSFAELLKTTSIVVILNFAASALLGGLFKREKPVAGT